MTEWKQYTKNIGVGVKMKYKTILPKAFSGWNFSLFGNPKFKIKCGECGFIFKERINDNCEAICPNCKIVNKLPLKKG